MAHISPPGLYFETINNWGRVLHTLWQENRTEGRILLIIGTVFLAIYFMPAGTARFDKSLLEGIYLVHWYAQQHVILCLLPAFLIAGAIAAYISQGAVMRFLGPAAKKSVAFAVASVSGTVLAVCSCTVLPLFGGIYRRGAGLGPAIAFLYSGPAINIMAVVITAKVLGLELGLARALGAVLFAVIVGAIMHVLYRREEAQRAAAGSSAAFGSVEDTKSLPDTVVFFSLLIGILVFANWAIADSAIWQAIYIWKWPITALLGGCLALLLVLRWGWSAVRVLTLAAGVAVLGLLFPSTPELAFAAAVIGVSVLAALQPGQGQEWFLQSWDFAKQILPLLLIGVFIAGFLLGRPG